MHNLWHAEGSLSYSSSNGAGAVFYNELCLSATSRTLQSDFDYIRPWIFTIYSINRIKKQKNILKQCMERASVSHNKFILQLVYCGERWRGMIKTDIAKLLTQFINIYST